MDRPPHVHLIEPRADGHRMQYVRRLIEQTTPETRLSLSTFPSSISHPATQAALAAAQGRLQVHLIGGEKDFEARTAGQDGLRLQPAYWQLFRRHWASLDADQRGDVAVVPYLDYCSYAIGLVGSPFARTPFSGVLMRPDFHWSEQGVKAPQAAHAWVKRWLITRLLANRFLRRALTIDPSLFEWVQRCLPDARQRIVYAEDPSDLQGQGDKADSRAALGLADQDFVILVFGAIDLRKGIERLIGLTESRNFPARAKVLLVGRQSAEVRALLATRVRASARWLVIDRYVDRQDEWAAFTAADVVWVAYEGFYGPSGVVAQCRQLELPAIHDDRGIVGYLLRQAPRVAIEWSLPDDLACSRPVAGTAPQADPAGLAAVLR